MSPADDGKKRTPFFDTRKILNKYGARKRVRGFLNFLLDHNRKINLVSRETSMDDLERLAADCLIPFEAVKEQPGKFFDIGSGGGFPAIIILMAFPKSSGLLIERTRKKARFLADAIRLFGLNGTVVDRDFIDAFEDLPKGGFSSGYMKQVRPQARIVKRAISILDDAGRFFYCGPAEKVDFKLPGELSISSYEYYLGDYKRLHAITIFSKK